MGRFGVVGHVAAISTLRQLPVRSDAELGDLRGRRKRQCVQHHGGNVVGLQQLLRQIRSAFPPVNRLLDWCRGAAEKNSEHANPVSVHLLPQAVGERLQGMLELTRSGAASSRSPSATRFLPTAHTAAPRAACASARPAPLVAPVTTALRDARLTNRDLASRHSVTARAPSVPGIDGDVTGLRSHHHANPTVMKRRYPRRCHSRAGRITASMETVR
jgi:hypothetical protein